MMEMPGPPGPKASGSLKYRFDDIVVDAVAHTLTRACQPVSLEPKAFSVLLVLLQRADELVPRDDLLDAVWGHRHVTPGVLTRAIAQLRAALGDDAHQPRYIQTQHALGYRFIAPLADDPAGRGADVPPPEPSDTEAPRGVPVWNPDVAAHAEGPREALPMPDSPVAASRRGDARRPSAWVWLLAAAVVLGAALGGWWFAGGLSSPRAADASVAVMPFTSLSNQPDDRYFAEGLAVEMHDALAGIPGLKVAALVSPPLPGKAPPDPAALGRTLGVATVLDATVRRDGRRVRVNARLTDARTGYLLWAQAYEREATGIFDVQGEIAGKVVHSLVGTLPLARPTLAKRLAPTANAAAYDAYLRGVQQLLAPRSEVALGRAVAFFRQALKEDAGFARAQAGICRAEIRRFESARDAPALNRARLACERAASMDPGLLDVSLAMGDLERVRGQYPQAIEQYTRALQGVALRPDAYVGLAATQAALGNNALAVDYYERAHQLRPGDAGIHAELGYHHYLNGDFQKAIASYRVATTLQPDQARLWNSLGGVYYVAGQRREAAAAYRRSLALAPTYGALSNFASLRFEDGAYAEAADLYRRATQLEPDDYRVWGNLGDALAADPDTAPQARSPYARAAAMAEAYLKLKSDDALAPAHLAWYRANLGEAAGARALLQRADAAGTETAEVEFFAAQTLARLGDRGGARERVRRALQAGVPWQRIHTSPLLRGMDAGGLPEAGGAARASPPSPTS